MGDETADAVADPSDQGPDIAEDASLADSSLGSEDPGHEEAQADENSARNRPDSADEADDDDLTKALAAGKLDELDVDGDGKVKKRTEKPSEDDTKPEGESTDQPTGEEKPADAAEPEKTDAEEKSKAEDELSEADKQLLERARTKQQRKDLEGIFAERKKLRTDLKVASEAKQFADAVIADARDAGIQKPDELKTLIEQEKFLRTAPKAKAAEYLRKLADSFDPPKAAPEPVKLDEKLQDAVDAGFLSAEDAETLQRAKAPKREKPPEQQDEPNREDPASTARAEMDAGFVEVAKVAKPYAERYKADWPKISAEVKKILDERLPDVKTKAWAKEAKRVIDEVIAKRQRAAVRTPTKTTTPRSAPAKAAGDIESEEDELEALMKGRLS